MSYNGSGLFQINTSGQPVVAGTVITASAFNALTADLATGLTTAITKDGQTATTARITFAQGLTSSLVTDSTSTSSGSIITAGGLGVAKAAYIGSDSVISGLTVGKGAGAVATNTAVGASALGGGSQSGNHLAAFGKDALGANSSGVRSVAAGSGALSANTTGSYNVGVGTYDAGGAATLASNTTGSNLVAIGIGALASNSTASNTTAVGYQAGYSQTTLGTQNVYIGQQAGYQATGGYNTGVGYSALYSAAASAAQYNTAIGNNSFGSISSGGFNTGVGYNTGSVATTGTYNTFVGAYCGSAITTGGKNTIIGNYGGNQGGLDIRTASNYIVLSDGDGNPRMYANSAAWAIPTGGTLTLNPAGGGAGLGGAVVIRQASGSARIDQYNDSSSTLGVQYFYYNAVEKGSITVSSTATAYNTSSDYRLKNSVAPMTGALAKLELLKPCTYKWNADGSDGEGFIAHELAEVCPQAVHGEKDAVDENGKPQYQGIDVSFLVATLTAAIQELKAEFDAYKAAHP